MMDFSSVKRIVIKVGTSTLAHNTGNLNIRRVSKLIEVMSDLKNSGKDVIFVTSGAQGVGAASPSGSDNSQLVRDITPANKHNNSFFIRLFV